MKRTKSLREIFQRGSSKVDERDGFREPIYDNPGNKIKICIIGAGIAGLAAAKELTQDDLFDVVILEARDRIGGRLWSFDVGGNTLDLGGSWIHGLEGNPLSKFANSVNIELVNSSGSSELRDEDGKLHDYESRMEGFAKSSRLLAATQSMEEELKKSSEKPTDISLEEALDKAKKKIGSKVSPASATEKRVLNWKISGVEQYYAANFRELSLLYGRSARALPGGDWMPKGGYIALLRELSKGFQDKIRFGQVVSKIEYGRDGASVYTNTGRFDVRYVLCTVPLGVLKQRSIDFFPSLPSWKQEAIDKLGMGIFDKIVLVFPERFWPDDLHSLGYTSSTRGKFRVFHSPDHSHKNVLIGLVSCDYAKKMEKYTDQQITTKVMKILRKIYGSNIPNPSQSIITRWGQDPFSRGAYSFCAVGSSPADYHRLAEPLENTLFFAGEATTAEFYGYSHGAFLTGIQEANHIKRFALELERRMSEASPPPFRKEWSGALSISAQEGL